MGLCGAPCLKMDKKDAYEKHAKVRVWLEQIFAGQDIPRYEFNNRTLDILYDLAEKNIRRDSDTELVIEDLRQKTVEYAAEAERLEKILNGVGFPLSSLSQSGTVSLQTLANIAVILGLKDCSMSSILLGLMELSQDLSSIQEQRDFEKHKLAKLLAKTTDALVKANALQRSLEALKEQESLQKPLLEKRYQETGFLKSKCTEYHKIIKELKENHHQVGFDQSVGHETLVAKAEAVDLLKEEVKPLKAKLDSYHSLPPDITLAKVKVKEAERELARLEKQLSSNIEMLHM